MRLLFLCTSRFASKSLPIISGDILIDFIEFFLHWWQSNPFSAFIFWFEKRSMHFVKSQLRSSTIHTMLEISYWHEALRLRSVHGSVSIIHRGLKLKFIRPLIRSWTKQHFLSIKIRLSNTYSISLMERTLILCCEHHRIIYWLSQLQSIII